MALSEKLAVSCPPSAVEQRNASRYNWLDIFLTATEHLARTSA